MSSPSNQFARISALQQRVLFPCAGDFRIALQELRFGLRVKTRARILVNLLLVLAWRLQVPKISRRETILVDDIRRLRKEAEALIS